MATTRPKITEGDAFEFPLESGGLAAGVVLRIEPSTARLRKFMYLASFGTRLDRPWRPDDLSARDITSCVVFGLYYDARHLVDGRWRRIGPMPGYSRESWPLPLVSYEILNRIVRLDFDRSSAYENWKVLRQEVPERWRKYILFDRGCGGWDGIEYHTDWAIADPTSRFASKVTPEHLVAWRECLEWLSTQPKFE